MLLRYNGRWIKTDKEKIKQLPLSDILKAYRDYFIEETEYIAERMKNYWIGYVDVNEQEILCGEEKPFHKELLSVSIIVGRHGDGQWFSKIGKDTVKRLVDEWEPIDKKRYELTLDLGCGFSQRYTFTRKQKNMLIDKLKPLLEKKWYEEECEEM